ncbi:hypothetical protein E4U53_001488 [Claviceps sorghi]|nr:hypothetical protein E4U53_001488 [Claviceps sorghi]
MLFLLLNPSPQRPLSRPPFIYPRIHQESLFITVKVTGESQGRRPVFYIQGGTEKPSVPPLEQSSHAVKVGAQQSTPVPKVKADKHMSRRFYIETSASGKNQFVSIKRSRSHDQHHHHRHKKHHGDQHHHHHHHAQPQETYFDTRDYYKVRVDDWNHIKERERCLAAEVDALKASLAAAQADANHLGQVVVPQLQTQIGVLTTDNDALRKSLDKAGNNESKHCREEEKLQQTIEKLEKEEKELKDENVGLKDKVKNLQRQMEQGESGRRSRASNLLLDEIEYWRNLYRHWKDKHDDTKRLHDDVCVTLEIRTEKMRAYEEILKRRRII